MTCKYCGGIACNCTYTSHYPNYDRKREREMDNKLTAEIEPPPVRVQLARQGELIARLNKIKQELSARLDFVARPLDFVRPSPNDKQVCELAKILRDYNDTIEEISGDLDNLLWRLEI